SVEEGELTSGWLAAVSSVAVSAFVAATISSAAGVAAGWVCSCSIAAWLVPVLLQRRVSLMPCLVLLPELIPPAGAEVLQKPAIQEVLLQQGSLQRQLVRQRLVLFPGQ